MTNEQTMILELLTKLPYVVFPEYQDETILFRIKADGENLEECKELGDKLEKFISHLDGVCVIWNDCEGYYNEGMIDFR